MGLTLGRGRRASARTRSDSVPFPLSGTPCARPASARLPGTPALLGRRRESRRPVEAARAGDQRVPRALGDAPAALLRGALCNLRRKLKRPSVESLPLLPRGPGPVPSLFSLFLGNERHGDYSPSLPAGVTTMSLSGHIGGSLGRPRPPFVTEVIAGPLGGRPSRIYPHL